MTEQQLAAVKLALQQLNRLSGHVCEASHHIKGHRHGIGELCPIESLHDEAITALQSIIYEQVLEQLKEDFTETDLWSISVEQALAQPAAWIELTEDDIAKASDGNVEGQYVLPYSFARAIEAKLKEKNTII